MRNSEARLQLLAAERKAAAGRVGVLRRQAAAGPSSSRRSMPTTRAVEAQRTLIQNQQAEIVRINALYDAELERLKRPGRRPARHDGGRWSTRRRPRRRDARRSIAPLLRRRAPIRLTPTAESAAERATEAAAAEAAAAERSPPPKRSPPPYPPKLDRSSPRLRVCDSRSAQLSPEVVPPEVLPAAGRRARQVAVGRRRWPLLLGLRWSRCWSRRSWRL